MIFTRSEALTDKKRWEEDGARLCELAAKSDPMPDGLVLPEQQYFLSMRYVYNEYKLGRIDREEAKKEKRKITDSYMDAMLWYGIYKRQEQLHSILSLNMHRDDLPCGKGKDCRLYDIICGLVEKGERKCEGEKNE